MSLSDDLIKRQRENEAVAQHVKDSEQRWRRAIMAFLGKVEEILSRAVKENAISIENGSSQQPGFNVSLPARTIVFGDFRVTIQPIGKTRVEIQAGATTRNDVLTWDGAGEELENWTIPAAAPRTRNIRPGGPASQPLTTETLEDLLGQHLGVGAKASP